MSRQEKLLLFLIVLVAIGQLSGIGRDVYLARLYGPDIPADVLAYWTHLSNLFDVIMNLGAAVWLYVEATAARQKVWVWTLSGLVFGVIGIVLFYVIQLYAEKISTSKK